MIFDSIRNLSCYRTPGPALRAVEHYLAETDLSRLPDGKYPVGRGISVSVSRYLPRTADGRYEAHRRFIDLQYVLSGHEDIYVSALSDLRMQEAFQTEKDIGFQTETDRSLVCTMRPGDFTLLFPQDAHMPGIANRETSGEVCKAVFKIPVPHAENRAFLEQLLPLIGMPEDASSEILAAAAQLPDDTVDALTKQFFADQPTEDAAAALAASLSMRPALCSLVLYLLFGKITFDRYLENHVSTDIFYASMTDFTVWERACKRQTGQTGLLETAWLAMTLKQKLYRLGRFQFEMQTYPGPLYTAGSHTAAPGMPAVFVHVPEGEPLTDAVRMDSYRQAVRFFSGRGRKLPMLFFCRSWLLYPEHRRFLQKDSNVLRFMDDFTLLSSEERRGDFTNLWRIFGPCDGAHPETLPETTGMQRAYKAHLLETGCTGEALGVFFGDLDGFSR